MSNVDEINKLLSFASQDLDDSVLDTIKIDKFKRLYEETKRKLIKEYYDE